MKVRCNLQMSILSSFVRPNTFHYSVFSLVLPLCDSLSKPQSVEQGISHTEVVTSSFCGSSFCCSIFSNKTKKKRREESSGIMSASPASIFALTKSMALGIVSANTYLSLFPPLTQAVKVGFSFCPRIRLAENSVVVGYNLAGLLGPEVS